MRPIPLLFLGDSPELPGGLSRIGRDLATLVSRLPQYRVGYLGRGGNGSRQLPFVQYNFGPEYQWGEDVLQGAWEDFSPREYGVIFTIWDPSRLLWFGRAHYLPSGPLKNFLVAGHFARWGYFPIDSIGPLGRLSGLTAEALLGYDKVLTYTEWADQLVRRTIGEEAAAERELTWFPHGINLNVFKPADQRQARAGIFPIVHDNDHLVGVVATNQERKDWGLVAQVCRLLLDKFPRRLRFWWHVDVLERRWSIPALIGDFGLGGTVVVTNEMTDAELAQAYSACNVTLHPGLGEGFGYPIAESLACGVPAIHGNYAGGPALVPESSWLVEPSVMRLDTLYNCYRPVYEPQRWVDATTALLSDPPQPEFCRMAVEHLDWARLWSGAWLKWWERQAEAWGR